MTHLQRPGGYAALVAAATYIFGFALMLTVLAPSGYGSADADASQVVAFLLGKQMVMYVWNLSIYVVNGVALVVLALALQDRLTGETPNLARVSVVFGLIWATLVIAAGMVANVGLATVAKIYGETPDQAVTLWTTVSTIENGLGGGNEIVGGIWVVLLSWAGLSSGALPKALCWLGLAIGLAGLSTIIPALGDTGGAIFGLGFIVWFIWVGFTLLRSSGAAVQAPAGA